MYFCVYTSKQMRLIQPLSDSLVFSMLFMPLFLFAPIGGKSVVAQVPNPSSYMEKNFVEYHHVQLRNVANSVMSSDVSAPADLVFSPLTTTEEELARTLNSHWIWAENTLEIIDSYSPFLFRTKKSARIDEVKIHLQVDSKGELSGFEVLGKVDRGLKERLDYVFRRLPACKPVPGYDFYTPQTFEIVIKK